MTTKLPAMTTKLPDKPSELIELALADLEKCERAPEFSIDMSTWFTKRSERGTCAVCLAGSVMAQTLGFRFDTIDEHSRHYSSHFGWDALPHDVLIDVAEQNKLYALNAFREGEIGEALGLLGLEIPDAYFDDESGTWRRTMPGYAFEPAEFKVAMRELAADLRAEGM